MKKKKELKVLPSQQLLSQIWDYLLTRPNKKGEFKKGINECLFLLCWKAGLRVTEAISFDLSFNELLLIGIVLTKEYYSITTMAKGHIGMKIPTKNFL